MALNSNYDVKILIFKEAPTAILLCKYYAFKEPQTAVVSVSRPTMLSKGPPTAVVRVSRPTMLSKGPTTAILMCKYYAFKGAPSSNCDVKFLALKEAANSNFNV